MTRKKQKKRKKRNFDAMIVITTIQKRVRTIVTIVLWTVSISSHMAKSNKTGGYILLVVTVYIGFDTKQRSTKQSRVKLGKLLLRNIEAKAVRLAGPK